MRQDMPDFEQGSSGGRFPNNSTPIRRWTGKNLVAALQEAGLKPRQIAIFNDVQRVDVHHFIHKEFHKISRRKKKLLLEWFRRAGFLAYPLPRVRIVCPQCGKARFEKIKKENSNG